MEAIILRLIDLLKALLDFPNLWSDDEGDYRPLHDEALLLLNTNLANLLAWCKSDHKQGNKIPPELDDLRAVLGRVIDKGRYTVNAFADTLKEIEEDKQTRPFLWQIADESLSWQHWINRYYPIELQGENATAIQEPSPTADNVPIELTSNEARDYFIKAIRLGLMSEQYNWLASKTLLACFCREMSVKLDLGKGYNSEGQKRLSWKPFEQLFGLKNGSLRSFLNDIHKTGQNPIGIEKINAIFQE